ncbi:MAG TPA: cytochrome c biogenesis protein CcdA [Tepidisphaeraceae bacterium]|jgi:thiol:disulfide interchange protein DsbD
MRSWFGLIVMVIGVGIGSAAIAQPKPEAVSAHLNFTAVHPGQQAAVAIVLDLQRGFHAQSHTPKDPNLIALSVRTDARPLVTLGQPIYPPGHDENYPGLGEVNVYSGRTIVYVPIEIANDAKPGPLTLGGTIRYQVCDDKMCFAPQTTPWRVEFKVVGAGETTEANQAELFKGYTPAAASRGSAATQPANSPAPPTAVVVDGQPRWGVPAALGAAFVAGILFNIVPCVLPVLPIKVLGFAEVAQHDRAKTVGLASVFGAGIVAVFAALALFILVLKRFTWGQQFSNPWFAWGVVVLLTVLAFWMFGWLNVNLPGGVYSFSPRHDTYLGNFEWGVLTAVLSTPCTGPLFPPLMLWAQAQPVVLGVWAVTMVGVGMAFPYILLSAFPELARRFPRVGPWAELFKQMMGFLLLGAAVFFAAGRFLHGAALYWSLVPVAIVAGAFLLIRTVQHGAHGRGIAIASVLAALMIAGTTAMAATFVSPVKWQPYADQTIEQARKEGKIVLVKFTANWCLNCQYIERTVFHDRTTAAALDRHHVVAFKADLTAEDAPGWERLKTLSATGGIPLTAIYVPGQEKPIVIDSVYTSGTLIRTLDEADRSKLATLSGS